MERGIEQSARTEDPAVRRAVQLLTAHVLALALDADQSVRDCGAEVARVSRGELGVLYQVHERVRRLAIAHPGTQADRALDIVDGATERIDSLNRHPSSERVVDLSD